MHAFVAIQHPTRGLDHLNAVRRIRPALFATEASTHAAHLPIPAQA